MDSRPAKLFQIWSGAVLGAGGKPSTWFPPGWLVEQSLKKIPRARGTNAHSKTTRQTWRDERKHTPSQTTYTKEDAAPRMAQAKAGQGNKTRRNTKKQTTKQKSEAKQNTARAKDEESRKNIHTRQHKIKSQKPRRADTRHAKSRRDATTHATQESAICDESQL